MTDIRRETDPVSSRRQADTGSVVPYGGRELPVRPRLTTANGAPVLVKATPPFSIRLSEFLWALSFAVGGFAAVYFFVIRKDLLPLIAENAKKVADGRNDETYDAAADIIFWIVFALILVALFAQITLLVSFVARRAHVRWWQLATLCLQVLVVLLSPEWVALGTEGSLLQPLLAAQAALVLLALLTSILPAGIRWSTRRFDVRRGPEGTGGPDL